MPTLHVVGDSISQHYGPYLADYLAGTLDYSRKEGMPGDPDDANGANGGDSSAVLRYLSACKERGYHWDYLLLNCGLHDLRTDTATGAKQIPPDAYRTNLRAIIALARTLAAHVIWVRTSPVVDAIHNATAQSFRRHAADVDAYNSIADAVMQESGVSTHRSVQLHDQVGRRRLPRSCALRGAGAAITGRLHRRLPQRSLRIGQTTIAPRRHGEH